MQEQIELLVGDITKVKCDAMVNAANAQLVGGGGVDGAIHHFGGPSIMEELDKIREEKGGCATGDAVITGAGFLPAEYVIHAVGPVFEPQKADECAELLAASYRRSLELAVEKGCKTIAFPNISTGVYRYPKHLAAKVALDTIQDFLQKNNEIDKVIIVSYDYASFKYYQHYLLD